MIATTTDSTSIRRVQFSCRHVPQAEASRLQAQLDTLRSSSSSNAAAVEALAALQARHEAAAGQLAALAGADARAAQLTSENDKLRERLERTEGQVGWHALQCAAKPTCCY